MITFLTQVHGLKTSLLICDGASSNLTTIKFTHGHTGMYGTSNASDPYAVQPWFINPYNPTSCIYWLVCPSHQVSGCIILFHNVRCNVLIAKEYD